MAKQTFTTGQVLTAAQMTSLQQTAMSGGAASAKVASYVLVAADAGTAISMSNGGATTITVNTALFAAGDTVTVVNLGAGVCTVTAGTATVSTSGSLVLAQNQGGILYFTSASAALFLQFATPASGDIEGVTAGIGISGGGTSGTVTVTNSMATEIDAKGDLVAGTGADTFARLPVGTNGQVLTADSAEATGLKFATPAGGGKVLQVVSATTTTSTTIATLTLTDTTLTATITPTLATSKIMVFVTQNVLIQRTQSEQGAGMVLFRDAVNVFDMNQGGIGASFFSGTGVTALETRHMVSVSFLDSPATTSATTYKTQGRVELTTNSGGSTYQNGSRASTITLMEIGA